MTAYHEVEHTYRHCARLVLRKEGSLQRTDDNLVTLEPDLCRHEQPALPGPYAKQSALMNVECPLLFHARGQEQRPIREHAIHSKPQLALDGALDDGPVVNEAESVIRSERSRIRGHFRVFRRRC